MIDKTFSKLFEINSIDAVLDLGAGEGSEALFVTEKGAHVIAIDRKPIPDSCKSNQNITWVQSFIHEYEIQENTFDLIILKNIVHFLKRGFVINTLGPRIVNGLRNNGILYLSTFGKEDIVFRDSASGFYTTEELKEIFTPLIFDSAVEEVIQDNHPPYGKHEHFLLKYVARKS